MGLGCISEIFKYLAVIILFITAIVSCVKDEFTTPDNSHNAIFHIESKYGINRRDIKEIKHYVNKNSNCKMDCGTVAYSFEYNGKTAQVFYHPVSKDYSDSFQLPEISEAVYKEFVKMYAKPDYYEIKLNDNIKKKYDGNLKEVVSELEFKAYFKNSNNFSNEKADKFVNDFYNMFGGRVELIYFENEEDYNKYMKVEKKAKIDPSTFSYEQRFMNFYVLRDRIGISKHNSTKINLGDGIIAAGWDLPLDLKLSETTNFDLSKIPNYNIDTMDVVSKYYRISSSSIQDETIKMNIMLDYKIIPTKPMIAYKQYNGEGKPYYNSNIDIYKTNPYFNLSVRPEGAEFVILNRK